MSQAVQGATASRCDYRLAETSQGLERSLWHLS